MLIALLILMYVLPLIVDIFLIRKIGKYDMFVSTEGFIVVFVLSFVPVINMITMLYMGYAITVRLIDEKDDINEFAREMFKKKDQSNWTGKYK